MRARLFSLFWTALAGCLAICSLRATAQDIDLSPLPPAFNRPIDFREDILPIFEERCFQCHSEERPKSSFNLRRRETALEGGDLGAAILPGDSANSPLINYVAHLEVDMEMPPIGKGERLTDEQVAALRVWIDQGAVWEASASKSAIRYVFEPAIGSVSVSGDERKFREHWRQNAGFAGGIAELRFEERRQDGGRFDLHTRAFWQTGDREIELSLDKPDLGFLQIGYEQFRRYDDDTGGSYQPFGQAAISLGRDLFLDTGRAWVDIGFMLPDWPTIVLGYEHQFRDGEKSMLHWGPVFPADGAAGKGIFPAAKHIDENAHIIKLDIRHDWRDWRLEESLRGEFADFDNLRETAVWAAASDGAGEIEQIREGYNHFSGANTLHAEKQIKPWWLLSLGYLYADLTADAGFNLETFLPADASAVPFQGDLSRSIVLDRNSHVLNANSLLGPWEGLSFFAGVQNDWTSQSGDGDLLLFGTTPARLGSNLDQITTEENIGLRYTKLPNTVVYLDSQFQQTAIGQRENQFVDDGFPANNDFMRNTDASGDRKEYRAGLTCSLWRQVSFDVRLRKRLRQNNYHHLADTDLGRFAPPGNGFPAFIRSRKTDTDDFQTQLAVRPSSRLRTALAYRLTTSDYSLATDSVVVFGAAFPSGRSHAGHYNARSWTVSTTAQLRRWLHFTGTAAISDLRTVSAITDGTLLPPYDGQIYTFLGTANLTLSKTLHGDATYSFSKADFDQNDTGLNLPIGINYHRHGLVTGLAKQISNASSLRLQYGFFQYKEPGLAGTNDYTAHGLVATFQRSFQ